MRGPAARSRRRRASSRCGPLRASAWAHRSRRRPAAAPAPVARPARAGSACAPSSASVSCSSAAVVVAVIGTASRSSIGPVSSPASICMMVTPVSASPASTAAWIGAAPRQRGSRLAWMFRQPRRGASSIACGRISPYAATTAASSPSDAKAALLRGLAAQPRRRPHRQAQPLGLEPARGKVAARSRAPPASAAGNTPPRSRAPPRAAPAAPERRSPGCP